MFTRRMDQTAASDRPGLRFGLFLIISAPPLMQITWAVVELAALTAIAH